MLPVLFASSHLGHPSLIATTHDRHQLIIEADEKMQQHSTHHSCKYEIIHPNSGNNNLKTNILKLLANKLYGSQETSFVAEEGFSTIPYNENTNILSENIKEITVGNKIQNPSIIIDNSVCLSCTKCFVGHHCLGNCLIRNSLILSKFKNTSHLNLVDICSSCHVWTKMQPEKCHQYGFNCNAKFNSIYCSICIPINAESDRSKDHCKKDKFYTKCNRITMTGDIVIDNTTVDSKHQITQDTTDDEDQETGDENSDAASGSSVQSSECSSLLFYKESDSIIKTQSMDNDLDNIKDNIDISSVLVPSDGSPCKLSRQIQYDSCSQVDHENHLFNNSGNKTIASTSCNYVPTVEYAPQTSSSAPAKPPRRNSAPKFSNTVVEYELPILHHTSKDSNGFCTLSRRHLKEKSLKSANNSESHQYSKKAEAISPFSFTIQSNSELPVSSRRSTMTSDDGASSSTDSSSTHVYIIDDTFHNSSAPDHRHGLHHSPDIAIDSSFVTSQANPLQCGRVTNFLHVHSSKTKLTSSDVNEYGCFGVLVGSNGIDLCSSENALETDVDTKSNGLEKHGIRNTSNVADSENISLSGACSKLEVPVAKPKKMSCSGHSNSLLSALASINLFNNNNKSKTTNDKKEHKLFSSMSPETNAQWKQSSVGNTSEIDCDFTGVITTSQAIPCNRNSDTNVPPDITSFAPLPSSSPSLSKGMRKQKKKWGGRNLNHNLDSSNTSDEYGINPHNIVYPKPLSISSVNSNNEISINDSLFQSVPKSTISQSIIQQSFSSTANDQTFTIPSTRAKSCGEDHMSSIARDLSPISVYNPTGVPLTELSKNNQQIPKILKDNTDTNSVPFFVVPKSLPNFPLNDFNSYHNTLNSNYSSNQFYSDNYYNINNPSRIGSYNHFVGNGFVGQPPYSLVPAPLGIPPNEPFQLNTSGLLNNPSSFISYPNSFVDSNVSLNMPLSRPLDTSNLRNIEIPVNYIEQNPFTAKISSCALNLAPGFGQNEDASSFTNNSTRKLVAVSNGLHKELDTIAQGKANSLPVPYSNCHSDRDSQCRFPKQNVGFNSPNLDMHHHNRRLYYTNCESTKSYDSNMDLHEQQARLPTNAISNNDLSYNHPVSSNKGTVQSGKNGKSLISGNSETCV